MTMMMMMMMMMTLMMTMMIHANSYPQPWYKGGEGVDITSLRSF